MIEGKVLFLDSRDFSSSTSSELAIDHVHIHLFTQEVLEKIKVSDLVIYHDKHLRPLILKNRQREHGQVCIDSKVYSGLNQFFCSCGRAGYCG